MSLYYRKKENSKNKKHFFKDFKAELKKVVWPTPKQLFNNTVVVITIVLVVAAIVFVLDVAFESLNKHVVEKIKSSITTLNETNSNNTTEKTNTNNNSTSSEETSENTNSDSKANSEETNVENSQENTEQENAE